MILGLVYVLDFWKRLGTNLFLRLIEEPSLLLSVLSNELLDMDEARKLSMPSSFLSGIL